MLTIAGKSHIKRYLAQYVPSIAGAVAVGVGTRAEAGTDFGLQFEIIRAPITLITYDFATNKIVYKATLPADLVAQIYEVGLFSTYQDTVAGVFGTRLITDFNSAEGWASGVFSATGARIGVDGLSHTPALSATTSTALSNVILDLGGYSGADIFSIAINVENANTSSLRVRFKTDSSNYYDLNIGAQTSGYKVIDIVKGGATTTGSPDWAAISEIEVTTVSGAGGASAVTWDGIMIQDTDTVNLDYTLVARKVLSSPIDKIANQAQDIEFTLDATV